MITVIILNDDDSTFIKTNASLIEIYQELSSKGHTIITDTEGRRHILTFHCIAYGTEIEEL